MRTRSAVTLAVLALLEVGIAVSPLVPATQHWWHVDNQRDFFSVVGTVIGVEFLLVTAAIVIVVQTEMASLAAPVERLAASSPLTQIETLKDREFYSRFRAAADTAMHFVRIAYLAPYPPMDVQYKDRKRYYQEIQDIMKRRNGVAFKRLVRSSEKNELWVLDLLDEFENRPNIDIAILKDLPEDQEMPLALSVQVIDDEHVWLVAAASHENQGEFRDLYIRDGRVATLMSQYYDRLWAVAEKVLDRGRVTEAGSALRKRRRG